MRAALSSALEEALLHPSIQAASRTHVHSCVPTHPAFHFWLQQSWECLRAPVSSLVNAVLACPKLTGLFVRVKLITYLKPWAHRVL